MEANTQEADSPGPSPWGPLGTGKHPTTSLLLPRPAWGTTLFCVDKNGITY